MITLLFVGDGERDAAMLPPIVRTIVGSEFSTISEHWSRLWQGGGGYHRKLIYASKQALDRGAKGVVAVVDVDRDRKGVRLAKLKSAQSEILQKSPALRVAVGEAVPHGEAWLLDDPGAVRTALELSAEAPIKRGNNPKEELESLTAQSPNPVSSFKESCARIAEKVQTDRCQHAKETGFADFVDDVKAHLCPLFAA